MVNSIEGKHFVLAIANNDIWRTNGTCINIYHISLFYYLH